MEITRASDQKHRRRQPSSIPLELEPTSLGGDGAVGSQRLLIEPTSFGDVSLEQTAGDSERSHRSGCRRASQNSCGAGARPEPMELLDIEELPAAKIAPIIEEPDRSGRPLDSTRSISRSGRRRSPRRRAAGHHRRAAGAAKAAAGAAEAQRRHSGAAGRQRRCRPRRAKTVRLSDRRPASAEDRCVAMRRRASRRCSRRRRMNILSGGRRRCARGLVTASRTCRGDARGGRSRRRDRRARSRR